MNSIIVRNPEWTDEMFAKAQRGELTPACHDRSDHVTVLCVAGHQNHLHRTQVEPLPHDTEIAARCQTCGRYVIMDREETLAVMDEAWGRNR